MENIVTPPGRVMHLAAALLAGALGCAGSSERPAANRADGAGSVVAAPDGSYELRVPARWAGAYRIDSLSTQEQGTARPGALNLVYLPADSSIRPQTLVVVAVYDSAAWAAVRAEQGPPPGDSVAARAGRIYVVGLPQSNPFAPGSKDAARFEALELRLAEVATLVRVR
jgi:hypothetical protein